MKNFDYLVKSKELYLELIEMSINNKFIEQSKLKG